MGRAEIALRDRHCIRSWFDPSTGSGLTTNGCNVTTKVGMSFSGNRLGNDNDNGVKSIREWTFFSLLMNLFIASWR
ncbi:hypothetical protein Thivi_3050 [Thiocystis violascens DSM 198]|uniref:Uncharacterized protein n=1 Tax=Thiocystis violascens (strain ATCC 17096 / DSM 198 / 6111) TaxID=765911 RepID=I3YD62_THIV6|nr:hypothetical protein Thivi_3050 [Thiocystis violascens DSM 198]